MKFTIFLCVLVIMFLISLFFLGYTCYLFLNQLYYKGQLKPLIIETSLLSDPRDIKEYNRLYDEYNNIIKDKYIITQKDVDKALTIETQIDKLIYGNMPD